MSTRLLPVVLACLCLLVGSVAWAQAPAQADLERRLAELEKQLGVLLKEVHSLRKEAQTAAPTALPPQVETKIFALKRAEAVEMTRIVVELFQGRDGKTLVVTADPRTNSVLVRGRTDLLQAIEAVVARLDEGRAPARGEPAKKSSRLRRADLESRVALAEAELALYKDRAAWSQRMVKQGYLAESQARADEARLRSAAAILERAKTELKEFPGEPR